MTRSIRSTLAVTILAAAISPNAFAGEAANLAQKAEELATNGQHVEALASMHEAFTKIWDGMPLGVRKILFVAREPGGYGIYEPRIDNIFQRDEQLVVYSEPVGFGWQDKGGVYFSDIVVDYAIRNPGGKVLAEQSAFASFTQTSRERSSEFVARIKLDITSAVPGSYVLALTFHDQIDIETTSVDMPFEIR